MLRYVIFGLLLILILALPIQAGAVAATPSASVARLALTAPKAPSVAASASKITPAQAQQALDILQDATKRNQMIAVLRTIATASKPAVATAAPSSSFLADNLGAALLLRASHSAAAFSGNVAAAVRSAANFPALWHSASTFLTARQSRATIVDWSWKVTTVIVIALASEWLIARAVGRLSRRLRAPLRDIPESRAEGDENAGSGRPALPQSPRRLRHVPIALALLFFDLIPIAAFAGVANLLISTVIVATEATRLAILGLVWAYALCRTILTVTRTVIAPRIGWLRLVPVNDAAAIAIEFWTRRIVGVAVFGTAFADVAQLLGLSSAGYLALLKLVALIVHLLVVIVILRSRHTVAASIRTPNKDGVLSALRNRIADRWHYVAIFLVLGVWVVWAFGLKNGYAEMLYYGGSSLFVLALARLIAQQSLSALDRRFHLTTEKITDPPGLRARVRRYYPLMRASVSAGLGFATAFGLLEVWGVNPLFWFEAGSIGGRLASAILTIIISLIAAIAIWEGSDSMVERHMVRLSDRGDYARTARLRTLLPMLRTGLLVIILGVVGLTVLSAIGVNIGPLLASAGILGIAIGFGSQKLVQDLITGLFLLLEDAMEVGDTITAAGLSGTVEHLSIRTIRLRAGDGSIHIIPFSAVTTVNNTNRGIGNAAVSVNISYREDTDRVGEVMKGIASEMRADPGFKDMMRSDLQLWGVDKVDASVATMVGQIVCTDSGRWGVQREYNRRLKIRFQELGIEIANPTQTIVLQTPREVTTARDERVDDSPASPTTVKDSPPPSALGHDH